jgi:hypothetical protein
MIYNNKLEKYRKKCLEGPSERTKVEGRELVADKLSFLLQNRLTTVIFSS